MRSRTSFKLAAIYQDFQIPTFIVGVEDEFNYFFDTAWTTLLPELPPYRYLPFPAYRF